MKTVVADTSALISITLSGQILLATTCIAFLVPPMVKQELQEIATFGDAEGKAAKLVLALAAKGKIRVTPLKNSARASSLVDKNADLGQADTLVLAEEKEVATILMDDVRATYALNSQAKTRNIAFKISAAAIIELARTGKLDKKAALQAMKKMIQAREWEKGVLEHLITKHMEKMQAPQITKKKRTIASLFGTLKRKVSTQQLKDDLRKGWN